MSDSSTAPSLISGSYRIQTQENAREFLEAMGAPEAYVSHVMSNIDNEEFVIQENEDGSITLGVGERKSTVVPGVPYTVDTLFHEAYNEALRE